MSASVIYVSTRDIQNQALDQDLIQQAAAQAQLIAITVLGKSTPVIFFQQIINDGHPIIIGDFSLVNIDPTTLDSTVTVVGANNLQFTNGTIKESVIIGYNNLSIGDVLSKTYDKNILIGNNISREAFDMTRNIVIGNDYIASQPTSQNIIMGNDITCGKNHCIVINNKDSINVPFDDYLNIGGYILTTFSGNRKQLVLKNVNEVVIDAHVIFQKDVTINGFLVFGNNAGIDKNLTVFGDVLFAKSVDILGPLETHNTTTLNSVLWSKDKSYFFEDVLFYKNLWVEGTVNVKSNLSVDGVVMANNDVFFNKDLNTIGYASFCNNVSINKSLDVGTNLFVSDTINATSSYTDNIFTKYLSVEYKIKGDNLEITDAIAAPYINTSNLIFNGLIRGPSITLTDHIESSNLTLSGP